MTLIFAERGRNITAHHPCQDDQLASIKMD